MKLTWFDVADNKLQGLLSTRHEIHIFLIFVGLLSCAAAPGCVPNELANLSNLANLQLHNNPFLRIPGGAPLDSDGDMYYDGRDKVAAFQACLKCSTLKS